MGASVCPYHEMYEKRNKEKLILLPSLNILSILCWRLLFVCVCHDHTVKTYDYLSSQVIPSPTLLIKEKHMVLKSVLAQLKHLDDKPTYATFFNFFYSDNDLSFFSCLYWMLSSLYLYSSKIFWSKTKYVKG